MGRKKKVVEPTTEEVKAVVDQIVEEVRSTLNPPSFKDQFTKMYEITDKIVNKILSNGGTLKQDSYVVREEFGEAMAAGYRYLRYQGETSKKLRNAGHDNEERNYELEMYEEIADVFMMSTSLCRHNEWAFSNKPCEIYRPINLDIETYLTKVSEVLYRINHDSINEDYIYEFMEETYHMLLSSPGTLDAKIDKLYNKIFKVVE